MSDNKFNLDRMYETYAATGGHKELFYGWSGLNEKWFFAIHDYHTPLYDRVMQWVSQPGDHQLFIYYLFVVSIVAMLSTFMRKLSRRGGLKTQMSRWIGVITVLVIGYGAMGLTVKFLKNEMEYKRPYIVYGTEHVKILEPQPAYKDTQSFPSGHSAFSAFMVTALWPVLPILLRWLGVFAVLGIGWSRIALGVHFPADVLAGILIGLVMTWLVRLAVYSIYRNWLRWYC